MKRIQYHSYGGPELMRLEQFDLGTLAADQVAVRVRFAAINPIDWKMRRGQMKIVTGRKFPRAMGMDLSGTVIAVGSGVKRLTVGDAVFGLARFKECGALGEAVITREKFLTKKPKSVPFETAACLGTAGVTAYNGLVDKAKLAAGQSVFINGCAGSVGEAAVQIARMRGAFVSGSCAAGAMERAESMGVGEVFDYRSTDLDQIGARFDIVYDTAATMGVSTGLGMLRRGGVYLDLNPSPSKFIRAMFDRRIKPVIASPRFEILDEVAQAAESGRLQVNIGETVPLDGAIDLIADLEKGRKLGGKGLVRMSGVPHLT